MWAVTNPEVERLANARYLSLTTYRKDGTPVPTPVWVTEEEGFLIVITEAASGKVRRLRRDKRVSVAPCDARGEIQGDPAEGSVTLFDEPDLISRAFELQRQRYGLQSWLGAWYARLRRVQNVVIAIAIDEDDAIKVTGEEFGGQTTETH